MNKKVAPQCKKFYKVVREEKGKLVSVVFAGPRHGLCRRLHAEGIKPIEYIPGKSTIPPEGWGPLAVFDTREAARSFKGKEIDRIAWVSEDRTAVHKLHIYECYIRRAEGDRNSLWWKMANGDRDYVCGTPSRTVFAEEVILLRKVR